MCFWGQFVAWKYFLHHYYSAIVEKMWRNTNCGIKCSTSWVLWDATALSSMQCSYITASYWNSITHCCGTQLYLILHRVHLKPPVIVTVQFHWLEAQLHWVFCLLYLHSSASVFSLSWMATVVGFPTSSFITASHYVWPLIIFSTNFELRLKYSSMEFLLPGFLSLFPCF